MCIPNHLSLIKTRHLIFSSFLQEYKVSSFEQRLMNEIEYRLEQIPPINEDPEDGVFEKVPMAQQVVLII